MNAYEQALLFNNHGVALLASGSNEQREAIAKFRCALAIIKAGIIDESKKVREDSHHSSPTNDRLRTSLHSSSSKAPPPHTFCTHNEHEVDDEHDCEQEHATNTNILLHIQDFLEPVIVPFPEIYDSGEDGDFFLYRHGFIVSRSSSFSPSWQHSKEDVAPGANDLRARKRSFPGAACSTRSNDQTDMSPPHALSSPTKNVATVSTSLPTEMIEDQQERGSSCHPLSLDLLSSVVVFNMALAHNVEEASQQYKTAIGEEHTIEKNNLSALKEVSRRLYDMSIGLLGNVLRAQEASKSVIEAMVVLAASSNNLAKILFDQGNIQTARSTLKTLWYTTSWICEKVLLPQQEAQALASSSGARRQQRSMVMSHVLPRPGATMISMAIGPQHHASPTNNAAAGGTSNYRRTAFDEMDENFLSRTPGWERATTASAFLFSETDMEGFIMNVMLMYHSQPPIVAKAA